jgi:hypothetical protein
MHSIYVEELMQTKFSHSLLTKSALISISLGIDGFTFLKACMEIFEITSENPEEVAKKCKIADSRDVCIYKNQEDLISHYEELKLRLAEMKIKIDSFAE